MDESAAAYGQFVCAIASPLAPKKLNKSLLKLVKKATEAKGIKRGVREVVKCIRKGAKGVCIIAGDISPIDVISHLAVLCEDAGIPYIYTPSKAELGAAAGTKRPTSVILVTPPGADSPYKKAFAEVEPEVRAAQPVF
eukprot:EC797370.1.p1 GENE.EC797370.1~~EC797370.1.p1  ORF type:complete len:138 (+),score=59.99 EC797370.1:42-455(+)